MLNKTIYLTTKKYKYLSVQIKIIIRKLRSSRARKPQSQAVVICVFRQSESREHDLYFVFV